MQLCLAEEYIRNWYEALRSERKGRPQDPGSNSEPGAPRFCFASVARATPRLSHIRKQNWHSDVPDDRTNPAVVQRRRSRRSGSDRHAFRQHFRERDLRGVNEISIFRFIVHQALGLPSCTWRASPGRVRAVSTPPGSWASSSRCLQGQVLR